ncbi:MAG: hypothetical protein NT028_03860 [candidate division Zixibacteria bacterium]|nr:hypothetical protein [candidate division Zixibacteria bacterium]
MEFLIKALSAINPWGVRWLTRRDEERGIWRARQISPSQLRPEDLLVDRDYRKYFFRRPEDDRIKSALDVGRNVLVLGESLSGKTRSVYEALKQLPKIYWLYLFRKNLMSLDKYRYPGRPIDGYHRFFVIEDLQSFVKVPNFATVLSDAIEHKVQIVATCQSGIEREGVVKQMGDKGLSLEFLFDSTYGRGTTIRLGEIALEKAKQIAGDVGITQYHFNGMIGSIFEPLFKMQQRYVSCNANEKNVLITLKELYDCGLMRSGFRCSLIWIERALATNKRCITSVTLSGVVEQLAQLEFFAFDSRNQEVSAREAYLKYVVEYPTGIVAPATLQLFQDLVSANDTDPEALKLLGDRIFVAADKPEHFEKMAELGVSCCNRAVELSAGAPPRLLAGRQVDLGNALAVC